MFEGLKLTNFIHGLFRTFRFQCRFSFMFFPSFANRSPPLFSPRYSAPKKAWIKHNHQFRSNHATAEAEHIHVIVRHSLRGGIGIMANGGVDAFHFVRGDARTHARTADDDAALGFAVLNSRAHLFRRSRGSPQHLRSAYPNQSLHAPPRGPCPTRFV